MLRSLFKNHSLIFWGSVLESFLFVCALGAQWIAPYDPNLQVLADRLLPPGARHWMGTDQYGRDILSRLIYSARISLAVGLVAVSIYVFIGTTVGCLAGYYGGWVDGL